MSDPGLGSQIAKRLLTLASIVSGIIYFFIVVKVLGLPPFVGKQPKNVFYLTIFTPFTT